jgi:hypothetical protein
VGNLIGAGAVWQFDVRQALYEVPTYAIGAGATDPSDVAGPRTVLWCNARGYKGGMNVPAR